MSNYDLYVYTDFIISPKNGHKCKRITQQNIKSLGFESVDELLTLYPGFPTRCNSYKTIHQQKAKDFNIQQQVLKNKERENTYINSPSYCKNTECGKILNYIQRHYSFCSHSCSAALNNTRRPTMPSETRRKIGAAVSNTKRTISKTRIKKLHFGICIICSNEFSCIRKKRATCSDACLRIRQQNLGKELARRRIVRSKDEIQLFKLLSQQLPCQSNAIIADGWDADISIPTLKIAIFWNGPWHYQQMPLLQHSLLQVQTRDRIKTALFERLGWQVLVFEDRYHSPETAFQEVMSKISSDNQNRTGVLAL